MAMATQAAFDHEDKYSWFMGAIEREETNALLENETDGTFLVRESKRIKGDLVLCVKECNKVSHYIINRISDEVNRYKIGEQAFPDMPSLLSFYKTHYLDTSALIKPVEIVRQHVRCRYDFPGKDPEDLPFKKGEILEVILKDEDKWWTARNDQGKVGQIPVPYVELWNASDARNSTSDMTPSKKDNNVPSIPSEIKLPAIAIAQQERIPNAYDKTQLRFEKGERILVTKMHVNGQWEGELRGKVGFFPFTMVKLEDPNKPDADGGAKSLVSKML